MINSLWLKELHTPNVHAELPVMKLVRPRDGKIFCGSGSVWRDAEGALRLKCYAPADFRDGLGLIKAETGRLIPDEELFGLTAMDMFGREWIVERIWLHADVSMAAGQAVLTAELHEIVGKETRTHGARCTLFMGYACDTNFPTNRRETHEKKFGGQVVASGSSHSGAEFDIDGLNFQLRREDGLLWIRVTGDWNKGDSPALADAVTDALQFVFARKLIPIIELLACGNEHCQVMRATDKYRLAASTLRPLVWASGPSGGDAWELFAAFFRFVRGGGSNVGRELSRWAAENIESGRSPVEIRSLVLGVAVEGVVNILQREQKTDEVFLAELDKAMKALKHENLEPQVRKRILGAVDAMRWPRARDYLQQLADTDVVPIAEVERWSKLRNRMAHAAPIDAAALDAAIYDLNRVTGLFYWLLFRVIGYRGSYTDYTKEGWPTVSLA